MAEVSTRIPDPPKFYQIADDFTYSPIRIKYYSLFVAFITLGTAGWSIYRGIDNHSVVHNQMHTSMRSMMGNEIQVPVSYFTMDWLMTPSRSVYNEVQSDLCDDNGVRCDPQKWQSHDVFDTLNPESYATKALVDAAMLLIYAPEEV